MIRPPQLLLLAALLATGGCDGFAEVADQGIADRSSSQDAAPDAQRDRGAVDQGFVDQGFADQGLADQGLADQGLADRGLDLALPDQLQPDQLQPDQLQPDALHSPSFGQLCTSFGQLCPDGKTYCIAHRFDTKGFCTPLCSNSGDICTGTPPGTLALCNLQAQAPGGGTALLCGFVCKHAGKSHSCPAWPNGSTCDGLGLCHPN